MLVQGLIVASTLQHLGLQRVLSWRVLFLFDWQFFGDGPLVHHGSEVAHQVGREEDHGAIEATNIANQSHDRVRVSLVVPFSV